MADLAKKVEEKDVDDILAEIDNQEAKSDVNWTEIVQQIRIKNINFIKTIITSRDIDVNTQNPNNGKTLLIYAVIIGDLDLVTALCNFGADVHIKDDSSLDALDYAIKYGRYKISELVYYRQLSGTLGNDLKNISILIHKRNKEAKYIYNSTYISSSIVDYMIKAIKDRAPFDQSMLYYAWYFVLEECKKESLDPFDNELWETMMMTYETILSDTSNKKAWKWMKAQFINSLIWYLPHPHMKDKMDDMETVLQTTLFYELLTRVRSESKKQSDLLLKAKIDKIKKEKPDDWNKLISYNIVTEYSSNARQDATNCLIPTYSEQDLSEARYPSSTHFSAKKHYDTNIYLNQLIFQANILDTTFQIAMKTITTIINQEAGIDVAYRAGPVKTLARSKTKIENDYLNEAYPTSSKILDINRCALQFKTIESMMKYIEIFTDKIKNKKTGCIKQIIRCKNGWSIYNEKYTDIKLNVLIGTHDESIIAEIQFLSDIMSSFKKKAHKLYSIERKFEFVYNYGILREKMKTFKDFNDISSILKQLAIKDDVKFFKDLWENSTCNSKVLINCISIILSSKTQEIHNYLITNFFSLYRPAILFFIAFLSEAWKSLQQLIDANQMDKLQFIRAFIHLFDPNTNIEKFNDGLKMLHSCGIILDHNILSYVSPSNSLNQLTLKTPKYQHNENINLHENTQFKYVINSNTSSGCLYTFGSNENGMLGVVLNDDDQISTPIICKTFQTYNLTKIASNYYHHLAIDKDANVYWWGKSQISLYGFFDDTIDEEKHQNMSIPTLIPKFCSSKATQIAVGSSHTLILMDDGKVYSFGGSSYGMCGHGNHKAVPSPKLIQAMKDEYIIHIACGENFSVIISKSHKLFTFGENNYAQCGLGGNAHHEIYKPSQVKTNGLMPLFSSCGSQHTLVYTVTGEILAFGRNNAGQLGLGDTLTRTIPEIVKALISKKIVDISCGGWSSLCVTDCGECYSWGLGSTGHGDNEEYLLPTLIKYFDKRYIKIISCECGPYHAGAITENNELYLWGNGNTGCLGQGDTDLDNKEYPTQVKYFKDKVIGGISLGENCTAVWIINDDEQKMDIKYLKPNQQMTVDSTNNDVKVFIRNEKLYDHKDWMLVTQSAKYLNNLK